MIYAAKRVFCHLLIGAICLPVFLQAQQGGDASSYRRDVVNAVLKKIRKDHFSPKQIDDSFSVSIWNRYIETLDPQKTYFLQADIDRLSVYKHSIDEQLNNGSVEFFDTLYAVFSKRIAEADALCRQITAKPFDLKKKEFFTGSVKNQSFASTTSERYERWRKLLKYQVLKHYVEIRNANGETGPAAEVSIEAKAREKVNKWYRNYLRQAASSRAEEEKFSQYIATITFEIDPHTNYSAPKDARAFTEQITKRFFGIGMELGARDMDFFVKRLFPGGSAYKSGLVKENDNILAISDEKGEMVSVDGLTATEVAALIRGDKGTSVTMALQQPGEKLRTVNLKRDEVSDNDNRAKAAVIEKNGKRYGYIYLPLFYIDPGQFGINGSSNHVAREVEILKEQEVEGIIMDLRGNVGGALDEVVKMGSCFMASGPMTMVKTKDSIKLYLSPQTPVIYDGPLVVMVDENSASASEIFAAAMQDRSRALIVGTSSSFGKGTVQQSFNLGKMGNPEKGTADVSYGSIRLTIQKFYRVSGLSTQLKGVVPDIILQSRMNLFSVMENNFHSSLPWDSIPVPAFQKRIYSFNYQKVLERSHQRISGNHAYKEIEKYTEQYRKQQNQPIALELSAFMKQYQHLNDIQKLIGSKKELKQDRLLAVSASFPRSVNPASLKEDAYAAEQYKKWMQKLGKDIYLSETVSVLEDVIANPM